MSATNLTRNGLTDWLVQRLSAIVLLVFVLVVLGFCIYSPTLTYATWHSFFSTWTMKILSFISLLALLSHIWIGIWTVMTDYIKPVALRMFMQALLVISILAVLFWIGLVIFSL